MTPLILAADSGSLNSVKLIIEYGGFNVNAAEKELKRTALMLAAKKGYSEIVDELLKIPDIDVNKSDISGMTALHFACRKGDTASVELLLKMPDIDVNVQSVFTYGFYRVLYYCAYHVF
ncbi:hypothetical protein TRFO_27069 [Tritrichomonas foetus]|uniref:Uncharacterized protein n=1 Tax=Tritrichomonas foetus TaxID=1144522 RepID=A0A1J4K6D3_9EUKA|nr:hypothetical protein TRFO_27069 [Tritrichomonas foetus]|eukprot:OHT05254.1 hypothetical protein TRFO_27069 [Tritrichomonas foetus]